MAESTEELWVTAVLEEYKTLRAESIAGIQNLQAIVRYGVTALGATFALAFSQVRTELGIVIYSVIIPIFSILIFLIWANEFTRMIRVGRYIEDIERRINKRIACSSPNDGLGWETWLATEVGGKPPRLEYYFAIPGVFFGAAFGANLVVYWTRCPEKLCVPDYWWLMTGSVLLSLVVMIAVRVKLGSVRKEYNRYFQH